MHLAMGTAMASAVMAIARSYDLTPSELAGGARRAQVVVTTKADGDLAVGLPASVLDPRRRRIVDRPWVWLRQVHGAVVLDADDPSTVGAEADGLVGRADHVALAVHTADCVPLALIGRTKGSVGVVHAGWRGLRAGVVDEAVRQLRARGEQTITAYVGPCISAAHYEFGEAELAGLVDVLGPTVRSRTTDGRPALDCRAAARASLARAGVDDIELDASCTAAESARFYSHRARGESGRQALVVWCETTVP